MQVSQYFLVEKVLYLELWLDKVVKWIFFVSTILFVLRYRPSQPYVVMSSAVSLPNHTFTGQA